MTVQQDPLTTSEAPLDLDQATAWCERYAKQQYENFSVVTRFLPKPLHDPMYVVYAFCRYTDDLGDEAEGDRLTLLDAWEAELHRAFEGSAEFPIGVALSQVVRDFPLTLDPFERLIEANRRDQTQSRYETFQDVLDYCDYSANPVGEMVLGLFGYDDEFRISLSNSTCTALQLTNHWQDVARDYAMGRMYLPLEDLRHFGVAQGQIPAQDANAAFRKLMRFEVDRAEAFFRQGEPLIEHVERDLRLDLHLFTAGGRAILRAIERQDYDVLSRRPTTSSRQKLWMLAQALVQRYALGM